VFQNREHLVRQGEPGTYVLVIIDGYARVETWDRSGRRTLLGVRVAGDLIGELAPLDGTPRVASVVAATETTTRLILAKQFLDLMEQRAALAMEVNRTVVAKLRSATRHRSDAGWPIPIRVARVLLYLMMDYGTAQGTAVDVDVPLSQADLASLIGAAELSINRTFAELRREGIIETGYRHIRVLDPARLLAYAEAKKDD
jgi:CRP-like cAMP-binding protein